MHLLKSMSKWAGRVIVNYWKAGVIEGEILGFQSRVSIYKQIINPTWLSTWTLATGMKELQTGYGSTGVSKFVSVTVARNWRMRWVDLQFENCRKIGGTSCVWATYSGRWQKQMKRVEESVMATATKIERPKRDLDRDEFGLLATDVVDNWDWRCDGDDKTDDVVVKKRVFLSGEKQQRQVVRLGLVGRWRWWWFLDGKRLEAGRRPTVTQHWK